MKESSVGGMRAESRKSIERRSERCLAAQALPTSPGALRYASRFDAQAVSGEARKALGSLENAKIVEARCCSIQQNRTICILSIMKAHVK